jgi:hypothetical protein
LRIESRRCFSVVADLSPESLQTLIGLLQKHPVSTFGRILRKTCQSKQFTRRDFGLKENRPSHALPTSEEFQGVRHLNFPLEAS